MLPEIWWQGEALDYIQWATYIYHTRLWCGAAGTWKVLNPSSSILQGWELCYWALYSRPQRSPYSCKSGRYIQKKIQGEVWYVNVKIERHHITNNFHYVKVKQLELKLGSHLIGPQSIQAKQGGSLGIAFDVIWYESVSNSTKDIEATQRAQDFQLGW